MMLPFSSLSLSVVSLLLLSSLSTTEAFHSILVKQQPAASRRVTVGMNPVPFLTNKGVRSRSLPLLLPATLHIDNAGEVPQEQQQDGDKNDKKMQPVAVWQTTAAPVLRRWMTRVMHWMTQRQVATRRVWQDHRPVEHLQQLVQQTQKHSLALLRTSDAEEIEDAGTTAASVPPSLAKASLVASRQRLHNVLDHAKQQESSMAHSKLFSSTTTVATVHEPPQQQQHPLDDVEYWAQVRQQPKSPAEEARLQARYAAIPTLEERAFTILVDLGMVQVHSTTGMAT